MLVYLGSGAPGMIKPALALDYPSGVANRKLGLSVSGAGDVNGDGYSDVIAGGVDCAVVFLGAPNGMTVDKVLTGTGGSKFGASVGGAGDTDADGFSDVVIGAPDDVFSLPGEGAVSIFKGGSNGVSSFLSTKNFGQMSNAHLGASVDGAGDVNGDGVDDFVAGAPGYSVGGRVMLWKGKAGLSPAFFDSRDGSLLDGLGSDVAGVGDFDGDGYSDIIVGAPNASNLEAGEGYALLLRGGPSALAVAAPRIEVNLAGAHFGASVESAGDVNGDGLADVIIGAPDYANGSSGEGATALIYGARAALPGAINFASKDMRDDPNQVDAHAGGAVAGVGDLDNDGYADVVVGLPGWDGGNTDEGKFVVHQGAAAQPKGVGTATSGVANSRWGTTVAVIGDMNNDGYDEIAVGAPLYDNVETDEGRVFGFKGGPNGMAESTPSFSYEPNVPAAFLGTAIAAADIDGDGDADLIAGAPGYTNTEVGEGAVFVWKNTGVWPPVLSQTIEVNIAGAALGGSVAAAGDVERDGFDDVIAGAPGYDSGGVDQGRIYVFDGGPAGLVAAPAFQASWGQAGGQLGGNVDGAGDVNGDGFADVVVAAPYYTNLQSAEGRIGVYLGSAAGLGASPSWQWDGQAAAMHAGGGWDVTTNTWNGDGLAGGFDITRDGYSDLAVGLPRALATKGQAAIFNASAGVLPNAPSYFFSGSAAGDQQGYALTAGDLDGNGLGDLVIGAPFGGIGNGSFTFAVGTPGGLVQLNPFVSTSTGAAVGSALDLGDSNHDGCADLVDGRPGYSTPQVNQGMVVFSPGCNGDPFWAGGNGGGPRLDPNQRKVAAGSRIAPGLRAPGPGFDVGFGVTRTSVGRQFVKVEVELKPRGVPFDGTGLIPSGPVDVGVTGVPVNVGLGTLAEDTAYHWRARIRYGRVHATSDLGSRWYYGGASGDAAGAHVVTGCIADFDNDGIGDCADRDDDNDGDPDTTDCDDANKAVFTGAPEVCDLVDQDCDDNIVESFTDTDADNQPDCVDVDDDQDGFSDIGDCAPLDASVHPGVLEACDGKDQNCSGTVDEGFPNLDGDAFADCVDTDRDGDGDPDVSDCRPIDKTIFTGATEQCDTTDQDCDNDLVDTFTDTDVDALPDCVDTDDDGDGVTDSNDCAPLDKVIHVGAAEVCDGVDQDCDGDLVETFENFDSDAQPDCFDTDDDNDGKSDTIDCAPFDAMRYPGAVEACDSIDSDCDGDLVDGAVNTDLDVEPDCTDLDDDNDADPDVTDCSPLDATVHQGAGCGGDTDTAHTDTSGETDTSVDTDTSADTDSTPDTNADTEVPPEQTVWYTGGGCETAGGSAGALWLSGFFAFIRRRRSEGSARA